MSDTNNDRLLSIEVAMRDMASQTGKLVVQHELLNISVTNGFAELRQGQQDLMKKDVETDNRIKPLEEAAAKRAATRASRIGIAKKVSLAALVASAGVFGTVAGDKVVALFGQLFGH